MFYHVLSAANSLRALDMFYVFLFFNIVLQVKRELFRRLAIVHS